MTVAVHFAATATTDALPKIARGFDGLKALIGGAAENAELLVNHPERKVQFMIYFASFEDSHAFLKANAEKLMQPFRGMLQDVKGPFFLALEGEIESARSR
jgi:hypothetical protein